MKKLWISILAGLLVFPMLLQSPAQADAPIKIVIDGVPLPTDQPPISVRGRTLVPLRAIFEAFDATTTWDKQTKTVTATKEDTTIVLKLGSTLATINNKPVILDVPGQSLKGRTLVPTRFVSEALGQEVVWNSKARTVSITTSGGKGGSVSPASNVVLQDVSDSGDGRDLQVSFVRAADESIVDHYRVLIVKAGNTLNLSSAQQIAPSNYSTVLSIGANPAFKLNAGSRDISGELIKVNQPYIAYVLAVGKGNNTSALSNSSATLTLVNNIVSAPTNIQVNDVGDNGDGRDLSVSFNKLPDESKVNSYRIFVVKAANYTNFNVAAANAVSSSNYTQVSKTGNNLSQVLASGSRDVDGALIKSGVSYRVFVMAVDSRNASNQVLSPASSAITLSTTGISSFIVSDVNDYGDGRDMKVSFVHPTAEANINQYRIMVVPTAYYSGFSVSEANNVSSSNYTAVSTSGSSTNQILTSSTRDVRGNLIKNGTGYQVYVLSVGSNSSANVLSSASSVITLLTDFSMGAVSNLTVSDVSDNGDGRDMKVSFTHAVDERYISKYLIMVVPTSYYSNFSVSEANRISSSNYTAVSTSEISTSQILNSSSRDVRGNWIKEGTTYKVYVLSVGSGNYSGSNVLSQASSDITLSSKTPVVSVTNVTYQVNDSRILARFTKSSNETNISEYRVLVVPAKQGFGLGDAIGVTASSYNFIIPNGTNPVITASTIDVNGSPIIKGKKYKLYILAVANNKGTQNGGLSDSTEEFEL
ncbi:copper amine oxidase N-terminal domain-containing protein [Paenibacillus sp. FSL M7-1046]|uniref:copper amine oxidase N-terminal domain-containing protein n=1 Tax=Paenibacillus sp. FSL M7-1046 TaxID=2975315 RepID=UPI0030F59527